MHTCFTWSEDVNVFFLFICVCVCVWGGGGEVKGGGGVLILPLFLIKFFSTFFFNLFLFHVINTLWAQLLLAPRLCYGTLKLCIFLHGLKM